MDPTGVAFLGGGYIAFWHTAAIRASDRAELIGLASRTPGTARHRARLFNTAPYTFADADQLIRHPQVDLVFVLSPNRLHNQHALAAISAGKSVVVEKPLTMTLEEAAAVVAAAERHNVLAGYAENHIFAPLVQKMRAMIDGGSISEVRRVRAVFGHAGPPAQGWQRESRESGSGVFMDLGSHAIATALYLSGSPRIVEVDDAHIEAVEGYDRAASATFHGEDGIELAVETFWGGAPDACFYEVEGKDGGLRATLVPAPQRLTWQNSGGDTTDVAVPALGDPSVRAFVNAQGYGDQLAHFVAAHRREVEPLVTAREGETILRLMLAGYRAAARGAAVRTDEPIPEDLSPIQLYQAEHRAAAHHQEKPQTQE